MTLAQAASATAGVTGSLSSSLALAVLVGFTAGTAVIVPSVLIRQSASPKISVGVASSQQKSQPMRVTLTNPINTEVPKSQRIEPAPTRDVARELKPAQESIAREAELLAEAQRAIKSGAPAVALETLNRYLDECPKARLNEEATATRVLGLCALGRVVEGKRWAVEFEARYPNSPLIQRVRNACSSQNGAQFPVNTEKKSPDDDIQMIKDRRDTKYTEEAQ